MIWEQAKRKPKFLLRESGVTRREWLQACGVAISGLGSGNRETSPIRGSKASLKAIPSLLARGPGHQFVVYADCCSGVPGTKQEKNFAVVNAMIARLNPKPEFICFLGDHVTGSLKDPSGLRAQWNYWLNNEMAWLDRRAIPIYHTTGNHNTYDTESEDVWREIFPEIPRNGPSDQQGLSYYVRRGDLLLVCVNTSFSGLGGYGHVESTWLDHVLTENADAAFKFVAGHHPIHPVNGYARYPLWRVVPNQGEQFWKVLVKHRARAYLCSHIIAFDVQVHEGVLQVTTGGAGNNLLMPSRTEFYHAVQMVIDKEGLRYQVLNTKGQIREWLDWPLSIPPPERWENLDGDEGVKKLQGAGQRSGQESTAQWLSVWRFSGVLKGVIPDGTRQTLLCGWEDREGVPTIYIGLEGYPQRLTVRLLPESGIGNQTWIGPVVTPGGAFDFQVGLHSGMGPGGILHRKDDRSSWSSLSASSVKGAEDLIWPSKWSIGCSQSGQSDEPFLGEKLRVTWTKIYAPIPGVSRTRPSNLQ